MKYRALGRTGISVSELIFGCGAVGGLMIRGERDDMTATVRRALDAGINWFDTAESYGDGVSEQSLGAVLEELGASPYVSTKLRLDTSDLSDIPGEILRRAENSLKRLRRGQVDVLQIHNFIGPQTTARTIAVAEILRPGGVADGLEDLKSRGLTRFIGLTALGDAASCRRVIESGRFDTAQVYYNFLNPSAARKMPAAWTGQDFGGIVDACRAQGTGVIAIRAFAAGVLATEVRHGREVILTSDTDLAEEERKARAAFEALGGDYGTRAQTAIRFALANPDIGAVNIGLAEPRHLEEALPAVALGPLPAAALTWLDALYPTDFRGA